jgi:ankyrin repeat protein
LTYDEREFLKQIASRLDHLCRIFSRKGFVLDWSVDNKKTLKSSCEKFTFTINGAPIFNFDVDFGHFEFKCLFINKNDWRRDINSRAEGLLQSFYSKEKPSSLFLNTNMQEHVPTTIDFWRTKSTNTSTSPAVTLSLRMLYKLFGDQVDDEYAQRQILKGIDRIWRPSTLSDKNHLSLKHSALAMDFIKTILVEKLEKDGLPTGENPQGNKETLLDAYMFSYEFGIASHQNKLQEFLKTQTPIDKWTLINKSAALGLFKTVKFLVGGKPLVKVEKEDHWDTQYREYLENQKKLNNAILIAVKNGYAGIVEFLLKAGADIESADNRTTLLILAAENGYADVVEILIKAGAKKDVRGRFNKTALTMAARKGHIDIVRILVLAGAQKNLKYGNDDGTPLVMAARGGHVDIIEFLIDNGADQAIDDMDHPALNAAIDNNHKSVVDFFLKKGVEKEIINNSFIYAAATDKMDMVELLISRGVDVNTARKNRETALMGASKYSNLELCRFLVDKGAQKDKKDKNGKTALDYAKERNHNREALIQLLQH